MEKNYNVCVRITGWLDIPVTAASEAEAAEKARRIAENADWNTMWSPETEAEDLYEEASA